MARSGLYDQINAIVRRVPRGRGSTYGQMAALMGIPGHARQVAQGKGDDSSTPLNNALKVMTIPKDLDYQNLICLREIEAIM